MRLCHTPEAELSQRHVLYHNSLPSRNRENRTFFTSPLDFLPPEATISFLPLPLCYTTRVFGQQEVRPRFPRWTAHSPLKTPTGARGNPSRFIPPPGTFLALLHPFSRRFAPFPRCGVYAIAPTDVQGARLLHTTSCFCRCHSSSRTKPRFLPWRLMILPHSPPW